MPLEIKKNVCCRRRRRCLFCVRIYCRTNCMLNVCELFERTRFTFVFLFFSLPPFLSSDSTHNYFRWMANYCFPLIAIDFRNVHMIRECAENTQLSANKQKKSEMKKKTHYTIDFSSRLADKRNSIIIFTLSRKSMPIHYPLQ